MGGGDRTRRHRRAARRGGRHSGPAAVAAATANPEILEGESLLNDATALLIYRLAVGAVAAHEFSIGAVAPTFMFGVIGSIIVGPALGWVASRTLINIEHIPTAIILQFVTTVGVWLLAEGLGLSGVLTMVCYATTVAQTAPARTPALPGFLPTPCGRRRSSR